MLLLVENTGEQQTALQNRNLLFNIAFRLQGAIQPVFNFDVLLNQGVAVFGSVDQTLAELMVHLQLLLHQRVFLYTGGLVRCDGFLCCLLGQGQAFTVNRLLQQLQLVFQTVDVGIDVITLFLQRILQDGIPFQALTLLVDLRVQ